MSKKHIGLGVIVVMSAKGTATLTASMLLPTWPLRMAALGVVLTAGVWAVIRHRRRKKLHEHSG